MKVVFCANLFGFNEYVDSEIAGIIIGKLDITGSRSLVLWVNMDFNCGVIIK